MPDIAIRATASGQVRDADGNLLNQSSADEPSAENTKCEEKK